MGIFDDKKFDELDWISQATEPIDSELNIVLSKLPEEVEIDFPTLYSIIKSGHSSPSMTAIISYLLNKHVNAYLSWEDRSTIAECFQFEYPEDTQIIVDFENSFITPGLKLIKVKHTMDEQVLKDLLGRDSVNTVLRMSCGDLSRMNEVMEILGGLEKEIRSKSVRKKRVALRQRMIKLFKTNEWNIRDTELANKIGLWIKAYVEDGNLAAWSNFCKLKVMTHKGQPIYSMEEIK